MFHVWFVFLEKYIMYQEYSQNVLNYKSMQEKNSFNSVLPREVTLTWHSFSIKAEAFNWKETALSLLQTGVQAKKYFKILESNSTCSFSDCTIATTLPGKHILKSCRNFWIQPEGIIFSFCKIVTINSWSSTRILSRHKCMEKSQTIFTHRMCRIISELTKSCVNRTNIDVKTHASRVRV